MIAAATLLSLHPVIASPRLISLAFNSQLQAPQQFGSDEFRQKLLTLAGKRFVVDQRGSGALGSENAILAATRTGAVDMAVISGGVVSAVVPELGVFDIPFLFRDVAHAKAAAEVTWQAQLDAPMLEQVRNGGMEIIEKVDRRPFVDAVKTLDQEFEKRFGKDLLAAIRSTP